MCASYYSLYECFEMLLEADMAAIKRELRAGEPPPAAASGRRFAVTRRVSGERPKMLCKIE